ncbi:unnamed protein product [marine sediment metagenome]|uniref:SpoVT-AbrB domain-containing protein n=1 Tax=marine sediment metagenome TaxID=412755 RepID=X1GF71_9ZZZZ
MKKQIHLIGGHSMFILLPKTWINKMGLKQGDMVEVTEEGDRVIIQK